jgi:hypothetical protein
MLVIPLPVVISTAFCGVIVEAAGVVPVLWHPITNNSNATGDTVRAKDLSNM